MVAVYIALIQKGLWSIKQVPERWRAGVKKALERDNH